MTIPMLVALISSVLWLVLVNVEAKAASGPTVHWAIDVCRILFAVAVLVVLLGITGKPVF